MSQKPAEVFHVSEYIAEEMQERGWDNYQLAPQQSLTNEQERYTRKQTEGRWYMAQKRRQKRRYAKMKAKREPLPKNVGQAPWNEGFPEKLHVCESVRALLPAWSKYK